MQRCWYDFEIICVWYPLHMGCVFQMILWFWYGLGSDLDTLRYYVDMVLIRFENGFLGFPVGWLENRKRIQFWCVYSTQKSNKTAKTLQSQLWPTSKSQLLSILKSKLTPKPYQNNDCKTTPQACHKDNKTYLNCMKSLKTTKLEKKKTSL